MKIYKGFTLTELMVALAVLGVLTALVLPMLNNNMPSRNRMLMKKAYYTIEDVVRELINNDEYYPELGSDGNTYEGFDNTLNACGAKPADSTEGFGKHVEESIQAKLDDSCQGLYKFPKLFGKQLNINGEMSDKGNDKIAYYLAVTEPKGIYATIAQLEEMANTSTGGVGFETSDGLVWTIIGEKNAPTEVTNAGDTGITQTIIVDVNGDKKPNCVQGDSSCAGRTKDFDRFKVYVSRGGKVIPASGQAWFEDAISIDSSINGD